jgi:tight adherence protein B
MPVDLMLALAGAFAAVALGAAALASALPRRWRRWSDDVDRALGHGLRQSFVYVDVGRLFRLNLVVAGALGALAWAVSGEPALVLLGVAVAGVAPAAALRAVQRRRLQRIEAHLPDALLLLAGALRAGASVPQALALVAREGPAPCARELDLVLREQRLGAGLDASMASLQRRVPLEAVTLFAAALRIALEAGGNLAETLERLAETLRRKAAVEGRIDALTAQGRLQGWVMAAMPVAVAAALFVVEPVAMRPLIATWAGWGVCASVLALEAVGLVFIRRIVTVDV